MSTIVKKSRTLSIFDEIYIKGDVLDGSVKNGVRQPKFQICFEYHNFLSRR